MAGTTLTQKAYLLMVNEKGELPKASLTPEICFVGTAYATLMDEGHLALSKSGIVKGRGELSSDLAHLSSVFDYVKTKEPTIIDFAKRLNSVVSSRNSGKLVEAVGASLAEMGMAHEVKKTFMGRRRYAPNPDARRLLLDAIRSEMVDKGEKVPGIAALSITLDYAEMLEDFFTKEEARAIKKRNDEALASSEVPRAVLQMVSYIRYVTYKVAILPLLSNDENKIHPE